MEKKVAFCVAGTDYVIQTEEEADYIKGLANIVEKKLSVYLRMGSMVNLNMAAVLAAMECCDEAEKSRIDIENLRKQLTSYIGEAASAQQEKDKLLKQMNDNNMSAKLLELEEENSQLRNQIGKLVEQISNDDNYSSDISILQEENKRLCEELEKANAFIDEASRAISERDKINSQLEQTTRELDRVTKELEELERTIIENY